MSTTQQDQRYQYAIDPQGDSTANKVLNFVGRGKTVLELGCGPGAMTRFMREQLDCRITALEIDAELARLAEPYCEKLYQVDLESFDFAGAFADQRFDVVIAADVLEHLKDPWACLRQVRELLKPEAYLIVSIPNIAHNAVIAQLLSGRFPYQSQGLLDYTHLRFFTRRDIETLLLETGFLPQVWQRNIVPEQTTEFGTDWTALPEPLRAALAHAEDGQVYQYIIKACPTTEAAWLAQISAENKTLQVKFAGLEEDLRIARKAHNDYAKAFHEARDLLDDKEKKIAEYAQAFEEARTELEQRIAKLDEVNRAFNEAREAIAGLEKEREQLQRELSEVQQNRDELQQERSELLRHLNHARKPFIVRVWLHLKKRFSM